MKLSIPFSAMTTRARLAVPSSYRPPSVIPLRPGLVQRLARALGRRSATA